MAKTPEVNPGQLSMPSYTAELIPPQSYIGLKADSRVALVSLLDRLGKSISFGPEPPFPAYQHADVSFIERGLYIPRNEAYRQNHNTEHVIDIGVYKSEKIPLIDPDKASLGVAFQPIEFKVVARSAQDLGRQVAVKTRDARWGDSDREAATAASKRSAGHALANKIVAMNVLSTQLEDDSEIFRHLISHIKRPDKLRVRTKRLEGERALATERIHDTVEVASIFHGLNNTRLVGQHRAVKRRIYNGNYSHAERAAYLIGYLKMVGVHNLAKLHKIGLSRHRSQQVLDTEYQQYLDEKADSSDAQQAA